MSSLKGKSALVTDGSRGIGRGIALRLAERGANVAINYVRDEDAATKAERLLTLEAPSPRCVDAAGLPSRGAANQASDGIVAIINASLLIADRMRPRRTLRGRLPFRGVHTPAKRFGRS